MTDTPTVSVTMPAYNEEAVIAEAIDSILAQTYGDWELIVVDDGSTDGTADVVRSYDDPRIRYHRQDNRGRGAARNAAIGSCRGRYVAIADADDVSLPERFEKQVAHLEAHPDVGVVSAQVRHFAESLPPTTLIRYPTQQRAIDARFDRGAIGFPHAPCMMRRDVLDGDAPYAEECRQAQDLELLLRLRPRTTFACLDEVLVHYRSDPRESDFRSWLLTHQYARYAVYRSRCHARARSPEPFAAWRRSARLWLRLAAMEPLRFARYKVICKLIIAGLRPPWVVT